MKKQENDKMSNKINKMRCQMRCQLGIVLGIVCLGIYLNGIEPYMKGMDCYEKCLNETYNCSVQHTVNRKEILLTNGEKYTVETLHIYNISTPDRYEIVQSNGYSYYGIILNKKESNYTTQCSSYDKLVGFRRRSFKLHNHCWEGCPVVMYK